jgi:4-amino-4-deoxy-L-arabinose transferase-like glycosyltransferase
MNTNTLRELLLYRYRYAAGYLLLVIVTIGLLTLKITNLPPGLSRGEEASAIASSQISLDTNFLQSIKTVDLPYHLLQKASLNFFGLGTMGVRLPSVILAGFSAYFLFLTLRRWFAKNVAVIMGVVIATSSWFLSLGRLGTPEIMVVFCTTLIMFLATLISQETKHYLAWKALVVACVGLSLYTPYMGYVFLSVLIAAQTQAHLRYLVRYDEKISFFLGIILLAAILTPLGWQIWHDPSVIQTLLAIPSNLPDPLIFLQDLAMAIGNIINPLHFSIDSMMTPLVSIPVTVLAGLGLVRVVRDYHSVRSHVLLIWLAVLVPVIGLNGHSNLTLLFVPVILLTAIGIQALFGYWYGLFPYNPYARIFGVIPLAILLISILQFNYQRYFIAVPYAASTVSLYDLDPLLVHGLLTSPRLNNQPVTLVVPPEQIALYGINNQQFKNLSVTTPAQLVPGNSPVIVAEASISQLSSAQLASLPPNLRLVVNSHKDDSLRYRVFTR